jgi:hypothetical protein
MKYTTIHLHTNIPIGRDDPLVSNDYLEHMRHAVYEGVNNQQQRR